MESVEREENISLGPERLTFIVFLIQDMYVVSGDYAFLVHLIHQKGR